MDSTKISSNSFRPLVGADNQLKPVRQIYSGFEIEKRWVLMTIEEDHTKAKNGLQIYNQTLEEGKMIHQGYIKDIQVAKKMLTALGITLAFKPNTIRLRKWGNRLILTVKDRKEIKKREVEWELDKVTFYKYWPLTKGARVRKVRLLVQQRGREVTYDAFIDRFLLVSEIEVADQTELVKLPTLGMDVTGNNSWANKTLAK